MEGRSKVAAAAASVVPFHCVICFEEFSLLERPPVVLPCGHTFVCLPCCKRLKRCMECREPLFLQPPQPKTPPLNPRATPSIYSRGGRYSPTAPMTPPQPSAQQPSTSAPVPLPTPKNLVLLAMMEAAERQAKLEIERQEEEKARQEQTNGVEQEDDEEEETYDLNQIISGMATMSGPCGTYAVRHPEGLALVGHDPRERSESENENQTDNSGEKCNQNYDQQVLRQGTTVQVVDFQDGVAKLARNSGFIIASSTQLVKVGGPLDKSCRLEGLLDTVTSRGRDLKKTLDENRLVELSLRNQVEAEREVGSSHPIISEPPRSEELSVAHSKDSEDTSPLTPTADSRSHYVLQTPEKSPGRALIIMHRPSSETELAVTENRMTMFPPVPHAPPTPPQYPISPNSASPNSIDNSDLTGPGMPRYRRDTTHDSLGQLALGCGAAFLGESALFGENYAPASDFLEGLGFDSDDTRQATVAGAMSTFMDVQPAFSSFDGIDFRTGLSGHRGLTNSRAGAGSTNLRAGVSSTPRGNVRMMMSEHRGIARAPRGPARRSPNASPSTGTWVQMESTKTCESID